MLLLRPCFRWSLLHTSALVLAVAPLLAHAASAPGLVEAPLAQRPARSATTLFTSVPAAQTGIVVENKFADPKMWAERYQELTYGAIGTGVAIGDYDNDGRPDVFVVSKTETSRLFRNLGNWKFQDVTDAAGLNPAAGWLSSAKSLFGMGGGSSGDPVENWKQGATFADVNNDGRLDLYVCRFGAPNWLFINQGNGTFKEEAAARGLAVNSASGIAAFCDYDRDGWLDVYLQTNMLDAAKGPNGERDLLFRNKRDGTFEDVTARAGIAGEGCGHSAVWWDYDADGWPDIYVANDFAVADKLYRNNGDGTFTDVIHRVVPHTPHYAMGADFGDVNNDGLLDFLVADMAASSHVRDQRGMAGSRSRGQKNPAEPNEAPQYMRNALYLNTGRGVFLEAALLAGVAATDWTWSVRFEDLDNDGRVDLHVTNGMNREYHNLQLLDRIMAAENQAESRRIMRQSPVMAETNFAFRNLGDLRFENVASRWGLDHTGVSFGAAFGDLDGDGDLDLVYGNYEAGPTVLRNESTTGHRMVVALRGTKSNRFGIGARMKLETASATQVREITLSRGYLSSSEPIAHFGLGDETQIRRLTVTWPSGHEQVFENLSAGQKFTVTEPSSVPPRPRSTSSLPVASQFTNVTGSAAFALTSREEPESDAEPQPLMATRFDRRGPALALADLNGDGRDDAVLGGTTREPARIVFSGTAGRFSPPTSLTGRAMTLDDGPVLAFDADGNGTNDLLLTKAGTNVAAGSPDYQPTLLLNDGRGTFSPAPAGALPSLPISVGAAIAADFNRDGSLDVFLGARVLPGSYPLSARSALLANSGGRFTDVTDTLAPGLREVGLVSSALWSDVDDDGWPDLLLALEWGTIRYFHNNAGRSFEDRSDAAGFAAAGTGWWTSLAAADFNGDGRLDYVAGNVGLNTPYRASPAEPALLFHGEFSTGRVPQLIEAFYDAGKLHARRTRAELGAKIPTVLRKFPRNDNYATASLGEVLGEDRLAQAKRFAATELRSGVFLSQPGGKFRFEQLPPSAQIAPLQGLAAGDFDGDGKADLYAVQNSFAPIAQVGRFDGGVSQLLRGDGRGGFTPVPPAGSNLVVSGDAKALAVTDLNDDGWPDFLVTRNNSTALAFQNQSAPNRKSLRVLLRTFAIGARITAEHADGSTQTSEIHAGYGYYSQSSATAFFGSPDANPIRKLRVRWPTGASSEHEISASTTGQGRVILNAP
jgi:enediyne biosynthesis protein E4